MKVKGTKEAVEAVAAIRDEEAGLPSPYSLQIAGQWRNVCPLCEKPIGPAPWHCDACGWDQAVDGANGAKRQMGIRLADVLESDGVFETEVSEDFATEIEEAKAKKDKTEKEEKLSDVEVVDDAKVKKAK